MRHRYFKEWWSILETKMNVKLLLTFSLRSLFSVFSLSTCFFILSSSLYFFSLHLRALFLFWRSLRSLLERSGYYIFLSILNSWLFVDASSLDRSSKSRSSAYSLELFLRSYERLSKSSSLESFNFPSRLPSSSFLLAFLFKPTNLLLFFSFLVI